METRERRKKHDGMDIRRRYFLGLGGVVLGSAQPALAASIGAASLTTEGRAARLGLTLEGPLSWEWRALAEPPRLVLSLPGVTWRGPARLGSAGPVASALFDDEAKGLRLNLARPALPRSCRQRLTQRAHQEKDKNKIVQYFHRPGMPFVLGFIAIPYFWPIA